MAARSPMAHRRELRTWSLLSLLVAGGIVLSGCLGDATSANDALPAGHDEHHEDGAAPAEELGPADVTLEAHAGMPGDELQLHPDPLEVAFGSVVEIRVTNAGQAPHTFTIHEFEADTGVMGPGEERVLKFRADSVGSFEIMCDVPGHYESGMKGTLEVAA